jgi:hypothetical protein
MVSLVCIVYVGLIALSNYFMKMSVSNHNETYEAISGIIFGFIAIPIFSIIIPFLLVKRWKLDFSFWPKTKNIVLVLVVMLLFTFLINFEAINTLIRNGANPNDFFIHFISTMLFHTT